MQSPSSCHTAITTVCRSLRKAWCPLPALQSFAQSVRHRLKGPQKLSPLAHVTSYYIFYCCSCSNIERNRDLEFLKIVGVEALQGKTFYIIENSCEFIAGNSKAFMRESHEKVLVKCQQYNLANWTSSEFPLNIAVSAVCVNAQNRFLNNWKTFAVVRDNLLLSFRLCSCWRLLRIGLRWL